MRDRKYIEKDQKHGSYKSDISDTNVDLKLILEVLLDIRDLIVYKVNKL